MGIHMKRLLRFAISYPGWHTYGKDKSTVGAIKRCAALGLLEVNEHRQFRLPVNAAIAYVQSRVKEMDINDVREIEAVCADELDRRRDIMAKEAKAEQRTLAIREV